MVINITAFQTGYSSGVSHTMKLEFEKKARGRKTMAYRRKFRKRFGRRGKSRKAGLVAKKVARKAFRGALRMPKRKLAKVYATKCGQTTWRAVKKKRFGRRFKRKFRR